MTFTELKEFCLSKTGVYEDHPFGPLPICFKVGGRIFMEWYPEDKITIRCEQMLAELYRQRYPGIVIPGYHCPERMKRYKNTVYLNRGLEDGCILDMIDHSYLEAVKRLTKRERIISGIRN